MIIIPLKKRKRGAGQVGIGWGLVGSSTRGKASIALAPWAIPGYIGAWHCSVVGANEGDTLIKVGHGFLNGRQVETEEPLAVGNGVAWVCLAVEVDEATGGVTDAWTEVVGGEDAPAPGGKRHGLAVWHGPSRSLHQIAHFSLQLYSRRIRGNDGSDRGRQFFFVPV
jgi:hypothetical protein